MEALEENSETLLSRPVSACVDNQLNNNSSTPPPINERRIATDGLRRKNTEKSQTLCERCVVVARQSDGFGLTVNGEYPVTVDKLKLNGAAQLAGVREGDRILKVNGMLVSCENFQEVIKMISGGYNLVLTLLGPARTHSVSSWDDELFPAIQKPKENNNNNNNGFLIPYNQQNTEEMMLSLEWQQQRKEELCRMLHKERANLESLQVCAGIIDTGQQNNQLEFGGGTKLERAICRINELEKQLNLLSLLNAVTNGKKRVLNRNDKKRGSIESSETEQQSSKTFPPTSVRTKTNNSIRAANAAVGRVEPIRSWIETGGMHYVQADVLPIGDEDEEEEDDDRGERRSEGDTEDMETAGPFANLQYLKTRPAYMAVFFSYLLNNANPSSLLFFLITDAFPSSNIKDIRRFAYEIFSTFLIPGAPLQLPHISQRDIQTIDKVLIKMSSTTTTSSSTQQQDFEQLKKLFIPTRTKAVGQINEQLTMFRRKKHLDTNFVEEYSQLESLSRNDHSAELRFAERILFKILAHLLHLAHPSELENCERKTLALIISVATLIKVVMCLRTNHSNWEKLLDKCPTFLSPIPKSGGTASSMLKMLGGSGTSVKQKMQLKEHQFVLQSVFITVHCYQCREAVWGVHPQAYFCQNCDVVVHKNCTSQLIDHCWPQQRQKVSKGGGTQQQSSVSSGRSKLVTGSTTSLTSPVRLPQNYHRDSNVFNQHYYPHSLLSVESSVFSSPALTKQRPEQKQHLTLLQSQKSSISLTPPINRTPHSASASVIPMVGSSKESSRSIDRHGNDLIPPELIDADTVTNGGGGENGPLIPAAITRLQHQQQQHMESLDSGSSPPSSTAMLPPPVFSTRFERILPPDIPPSTAPPPPPPSSSSLQKTTGNGQTEMSLNTTSTLQPSTTTAAGHGQLKSMDSGIGTDVTCVSGPSSLPIHGGIGRTSSDLPRVINQQHQVQQQQQHPNIGPTRSQSMKGEAANQLKRGAKGAGSLGAADAEEQRPITSQLAVPSVSSLKSSSSSAQELSQAFHEFPHFVRGTEAIASSSTGTSSEEEARKMVELVERTAVVDGDSDLDVETEVPSLESLVGWEVLKHLKPKEKKRQEVINELFHTERTHVRNLKILYKVFYRPMVLQRVASPELIKLLFGNLDELLQVHSEMNNKMREAVENWQRKGIGNEGGGLYGDIGELIVNLFDGSIGEKLMHNTALFCRNQQYALDTLRQRYTRAKDDPFSQFLSEAENNPLCRKLQLKDMIPVEMQRLVKYPLLLETIAKYTREGSDELQHLLHGIERAKRILSVVNSDKRNAENEKRMEELQQRLDFTGCEKSFFQRFDFRAHKLIYDGHLQWRQARGKTIDLHVVLLEHLLVFLTKIGSDSGSASTPQKLQLKIHEAGCIPIMRLSSVEVEEKQGDKRSFNLLYKSDLRVFELVAQTATERKTWFRLIENQVSVTRSSPIPADFENIFDGILSGGQQQTRPTPPPSSLTQRAQIVDSGLHQLAKVEHVHVLTHPALVNANEIVIQQPKIMENAQPIISATDRLCKNDKIIINALAEKHQILTELLMEDGENKISTNDLEKITELMTGLSVVELKQRNSKELAMSAIVHGNRLLDCINKGMNKTEDLTDETNLPSVPCYRLTAVAAPLMNHLKALLQIIQDQTSEIQRLKESEQSRKTASEETLIHSGLSPGSNKSIITTPHLTALRATPSNCSSLSSPTSPHTVLPFE